MHSNATSATTVTTTTTGGSKGDQNKTVAVGAGIGASLGALSIASLGAGFLWGKRKAKKTYEALQHPESPAERPNTGFHAPQSADLYSVYEVGHTAPRSELPESSK